MCSVYLCPALLSLYTVYTHSWGEKRGHHTAPSISAGSGGRTGTPTCGLFLLHLQPMGKKNDFHFIVNGSLTEKASWVKMWSRYSKPVSWILRPWCELGFSRSVDALALTSSLRHGAVWQPSMKASALWPLSPIFPLPSTGGYPTPCCPGTRQVVWVS